MANRHIGQEIAVMPRRKSEEDIRVDRHVGAIIRRRRSTMHLSQGKLAELIGVAYQQLQKYEAGVNTTSAPMLARLAEALDCSVADLFEGLDPLNTHGR